MRSKQEVMADVHASRTQLEKTLGELKARVSPPQLAEDMMNLLDPELTLLGRVKSGVQQNRLLSLAVLAGIGWLVGAPRRSNGGPRKVRDADTAPPSAILEEKNNDSGKNNGDKWPVYGSGAEQGAKVRRTQRRGKTQGSGSPQIGEHQHEHEVFQERIKERVEEGSER